MQHDDTDRHVVHAKICAPGAETLRAFCVSHGVTTAAFLDGLSHALEKFQTASMSDLELGAPTVAAALLAARQIDADRRRRRVPS